MPQAFRRGPSALASIWNPLLMSTLSTKSGARPSLSSAGQRLPSLARYWIRLSVPYLYLAFREVVALPASARY